MVIMLISSLGMVEASNSCEAPFVVSIIANTIALLGILVTYCKFRRETFISTITKERLDFIKEWRECAVQFCTLLSSNAEKGQTEASTFPLEYYYYKLLLLCNSTKPDAYMDIAVVELVKQMYSERHNVSDESLKRFIALMQVNIELEWNGATAESGKGKLSDDEKENMKLDCYKYYLEYINGNDKNEEI